MKTLPPELIDGIIALLSAAVGWFGRWLQSRRKEQTLKMVKFRQEQVINNLTSQLEKKSNEQSKR